MLKPVKSVETPCIGICSTVYGDDVCRGCKRTYTEVIGWNAWEPSRQQDVLDRLDKQLIQLAPLYIQITDETLLFNRLVEKSIRFLKAQHPYSWAYTLLRVGADKINDLSAYGLMVLPPFDSLTIQELYNHMDRALYQDAVRAYYNGDSNQDRD